MHRPPRLGRFIRDDSGSMLVFWAFSLVVFLGLLGMIFDMGRLGATQSELQSYADSVALATAAELDGRPDAITRARAAAQTLIKDSQTFADGASTLTGSDVTLNFYLPNTLGRFERTSALKTQDPQAARFVDVQIAERDVPLGLGAIFQAFGSADGINTATSARAAATFELEACNVAPVAMCAPAISLDADAAIGKTLELQATIRPGQLLPGNIGVVNTLTNALDGLSICAGLLGDALNACLIAAREPETACTGRGGLEISLGLNGDGLMQAINTRFGETLGIASGLLGDNFGAAPNILQGALNGNVCEAVAAGDTSLPSDDCFASGTCGIQGNGDWSLGRTAYINAHYDGTDPFPQAETRFEFYQAELAASGQVGGTATPSDGGLVGGLLGTVGGVLDTLTGQMCAPQTNLDPTRRLMVIAAIDCLNVDVQAGVSAPVVQYFEAFALGPARDGTLAVEVTACLGNGCDSGDGRGSLDTVVRDVVRLVD